MTELENRLRDTLKARADLVTDDALRPAAPPAHGRRVLRPGRPLLTGLAAAAATAAVVTAVATGVGSSRSQSADPDRNRGTVTLAGWTATLPAGWSVREEPDEAAELGRGAEVVCLTDPDGTCRVVLGRIRGDVWQDVRVGYELMTGPGSWECSGSSFSTRLLPPDGRNGFLRRPDRCSFQGRPAELVELLVPEHGLAAVTFRRQGDGSDAGQLQAVLDGLAVDSATPRIEELDRSTCDDLPALCPGHPTPPTPRPTS
jgi:hypothetical protein